MTTTTTGIVAVTAVVPLSLTSIVVVEEIIEFVAMGTMCSIADVVQ